MSRTGAISATSRRELSSFFFLQGKAPKEIHAILTETLACFLPGRAKDLSASLYVYVYTHTVYETAELTLKRDFSGKQWRTQDFCSGVGGVSTNSVEDRENGDLGAVAP